MTRRVLWSLPYCLLWCASAPAFGGQPSEQEFHSVVQKGPDPGQGDMREEVMSGFGHFVVDPAPDKPAFIHVEDLDADGTLEIVVSVFSSSGPMGSGYVTIYTMKKAGDLSRWSKKRIEETRGTKFPNAVCSTDVDEDGDLDLVVPSGFLACAPGNCGALAWLEQTGTGWTRHEIISGQQRFYHHVEHVDFDGDGYKDLVTVGEEKGFFGDGSAEVHVFYGTDSRDAFEKRFERPARGLGSIPTVIDLDRDGDLDIASAEYFGSAGSYAWLERTEIGSWEKHYIDAGNGKAIQLSFIEDLYGDGELYAVGANHTNTADNSADAESAVHVYAVPKDRTITESWPGKQISSGIVSAKSPWMGKQAAPGVFDWGDVDGDGDIDIVVHGDGDSRVFLLEQLAPGEFATHTLAQGFNQGGVAVADFDGDGADDIVASSYQHNKLHLFRFVGASERTEENE